MNKTIILNFLMVSLLFLASCKSAPKQIEPEAKTAEEVPVLEEEEIVEEELAESIDLDKPDELIFFNYDSSAINPDEVESLLSHFDYLEKDLDVTATIVGNTDSRGTITYNFNLGLKRAKAVYNFLVEKGIEKVRLTLKSLGETNPLSEESDDEARSLNRRVEIIHSN